MTGEIGSGFFRRSDPDPELGHLHPDHNPYSKPLEFHLKKCFEKWDKEYTKIIHNYLHIISWYHRSMHVILYVQEVLAHFI